LLNCSNVMTRFRTEWEEAGSPIPLIVSKSGYDEAIVSWEVLWEDSKRCWSPIAEFTTWSQAQAWADTQARLGSRNNKGRGWLGEKEEGT
jgi:hypothetical protein